MKADMYAFGCLYYAVCFQHSFYTTHLTSDGHRYFLILSPLREYMNIKLCDSLQVGYVQIDCKAQEWKIVHGISSRAAGKVILLNDR